MLVARAGRAPRLTRVASSEVSCGFIQRIKGGEEQKRLLPLCQLLLGEVVGTEPVVPRDGGTGTRAQSCFSSKETAEENLELTSSFFKFGRLI